MITKNHAKMRQQTLEQSGKTPAKRRQNLCQKFLLHTKIQHLYCKIAISIFPPTIGMLLGFWHTFSYYLSLSTLSQLLAHLLKFCHTFSAFGTLPQLLEHFLNFQHTFTFFLSFWHTLSNFMKFQQILLYSLSFWHTLFTYSILSLL